MWTTFAAARNKAIAYPSLGRFIAELAIPAGDPAIRVLSTGGRRHVTVWAPPEALLILVVDTRSIDA